MFRSIVKHSPSKPPSPLDNASISLGLLPSGYDTTKVNKINALNYQSPAINYYDISEASEARSQRLRIYKNAGRDTISMEVDKMRSVHRIDLFWSTF